MITDARLQRALTYLAETDEPAAELKADVSRKEYLCKLARSKEFLIAAGPVEQRKATAEVSDSVQRAEGEYTDAVVAFEKVRAKRTTEELIVEVYRTVSANRRQGQVT